MQNPLFVGEPEARSDVAYRLQGQPRGSSNPFAIREIEDESLALPVHQIVVQRSRELSNRIAEETGVQHETPQVILISEGKAIYHASHSTIDADTISAQLS